MKKGIETAISTPYFQLKCSCNIGLQTAVTSGNVFQRYEPMTTTGAIPIGTL